jgi:hypothetical protein
MGCIGTGCAEVLVFGSPTAPWPQVWRIWIRDPAISISPQHDHSYGITRLNVYAGEAAGYLLTDQFEEDLISRTNVSGINPSNKKVLPDLGGVYHNGIPPIVIIDFSSIPDGSNVIL